MKNRINPANGMEFGLYSLGDHIPNPLTGSRLSAGERIKEIIELARLAEDVGIDVFGVGESHQSYFTTQAHTVVLGAIAQATKNIKLTLQYSILVEIFLGFGIKWFCTKDKLECFRRVFQWEINL